MFTVSITFIADTTGATSQVIAKNVDLERNTKDPGKIYKHFIKNICYHMYNLLFIYTLLIKSTINSTFHSIIATCSLLIHKTSYVVCLCFSTL